MAELLRITCEGCSTSFVSAHQGVRASLETGDLDTLEEHCPHCGRVARYEPAAYGVGSLVGSIAPAFIARA